MSYKVKNAIIKRKNDGSDQFDFVDSEGIFDDKEILVAIDSDDLITIQLLINGIIRNDFKNWNLIDQFDENDSLKTLFIKLGYSKEDLLEFLKQF